MEAGLLFQVLKYRLNNINGCLSRGLFFLQEVLYNRSGCYLPPRAMQDLLPVFMSYSFRLFYSCFGVKNFIGWHLPQSGWPGLARSCFQRKVGSSFKKATQSK